MFVKLQICGVSHTFLLQRFVLLLLLILPVVSLDELVFKIIGLKKENNNENVFLSDNFGSTLKKNAKKLSHTLHVCLCGQITLK